MGSKANYDLFFFQRHTRKKQDKWTKANTKANENDLTVISEAV